MNEAAIEVHQQNDGTPRGRDAGHLTDGIEAGVLNAELARRKIEGSVREGHVGSASDHAVNEWHACRQALDCRGGRVDTGRFESIVTQRFARDLNDCPDATGNIEEA
jgi:hypothetical protein